jgi:hypothetical protein
MSLLWKDLDMQNVAFENYERIAQGIHIVLGLFALIGGCLVSYSLTRRDIAPSLWFILSIIAADLILSVSEITFGITNFWFGGWGSGKVGCLINAFLLVGSCVTSVISVSLCLM